MDLIISDATIQKLPLLYKRDLMPLLFDLNTADNIEEKIEKVLQFSDKYTLLPELGLYVLKKVGDIQKYSPILARIVRSQLTSPEICDFLDANYISQVDIYTTVTGVPHFEEIIRTLKFRLRDGTR